MEFLISDEERSIWEGSLTKLFGIYSETNLEICFSLWIQAFYRNIYIDTMLLKMFQNRGALKETRQKSSEWENNKKLDLD